MGLDARYKESQVFGAKESQVFSAGNHKWKIRLCPMENGCGDGDHLSLLLALVGSTAEAIKVYAEYTLRILDQVGAKPRHKSFQGKVWFVTPESSWGCQRFVSLSELKEPETGFLVNGVLVVEAEVTVLGISEPL